MMMNKILVILLSAVGLVFLSLGISYAVYDHSSTQNKLIASLELATINTDGGQQNTYTIPLADDDTRRPTSKFMLKNNSGITGKYRLLFQETPIGVIEDGCKVEDLMSKDIMKYELLKNNKVIKAGYLKDLPASILLEANILPATTEQFELKTWIPLETTKWMGKHFHYRISVKSAII